MSQLRCVGEVPLSASQRKHPKASGTEVESALQESECGSCLVSSASRPERCGLSPTRKTESVNKSETHRGSTTPSMRLEGFKNELRGVTEKEGKSEGTPELVTGEVVLGTKEEWGTQRESVSKDLTSGPSANALSLMRESKDEIAKEEEECCICLEEYNTENPKLLGPCNHHFHLPCLMNWKQRSNVCPMCASENLAGLVDELEDTSARNMAPAMADEDLFAMIFQREMERRNRNYRRHQRRSEGERGDHAVSVMRREAAASRYQRSVNNSNNTRASQEAMSVAVNRTNAPGRNSQTKTKTTGIGAFLSKMFSCKRQ